VGRVHDAPAAARERAGAVPRGRIHRVRGHVPVEQRVERRLRGFGPVEPAAALQHGRAHLGDGGERRAGGRANGCGDGGGLRQERGEHETRRARHAHARGDVRLEREQG
jgi:hypothetical protein